MKLNEMKLGEQLKVALGIAIILMLTSATVSVAGQTHVLAGDDKNIPTPISILGYNIGTNGMFTPWDKIVEYNLAVAAKSNRVKTFQIGTTSLGKPFIISVVTSPSNWGKMDKLKSILNALSDPRITSPDEAQDLIKNGIPVVWVAASQHANEAGSPEMSMELLYKLAASEEKSIKDILDNVIVVITPCENPDGHDMWVNWHYQWAGDPPGTGTWARSSPPYMGAYVGHDDNRDWFTANLLENQYQEKAIMEWKPQVFEDHHESGFGRIFTPPNPDQHNPNISPIVRAGWIMYGGYIQQQAATKNMPGYVTGYSYDMWYAGYGDTWPSFHNAYGMTFETNGAPYDVAYSPPRSYEQKGVLWNQPLPWTGGAWTLRDNINYQEGATFSDLELTATFKEKILWSYYQMGYLQVQKGKTQSVSPYLYPNAFLVPSNQKDPTTMAKMLNRLITQGVEVNVANQAFTVSSSCSVNQNLCFTGSNYPAGTYIIRMDQPLGGYAKSLLEVQTYLPTYPTPYDVTAWTMSAMMGVNTYNVTDVGVLSVPMSLVQKVQPPGGVVGTVSATTYGYAFSHDLNNAIIAMNRLLKAGYAPYLAQNSFIDGSKNFDVGTVIVPRPTNPANLDELIAQMGQSLSIPIYPISKPSVPVYQVAQPKIGLIYYNSSTADEGWVRLLLEQYEFPYIRLPASAVGAGLFNGQPLSLQFSVILLPRASEKGIVDGPGASMPLGYQAGIGTSGVTNLRNFVNGGGTLVCEDSSCELPIHRFAGIGLTSATASSLGINAPGSILRIDNIANTNPVGYGYPAGDYVAFWQNSYAYSVTTATPLVTYYSLGDPLLSGAWAGPKLTGQAAAAVSTLGSGYVVLFAFRVLNRDQPDNTFLLYFNSIYLSSETSTTLP